MFEISSSPQNVEECGIAIYEKTSRERGRSPRGGLS